MNSNQRIVADDVMNTVPGDSIDHRKEQQQQLQYPQNQPNKQNCGEFNSFTCNSRHKNKIQQKNQQKSTKKHQKIIRTNLHRIFVRFMN